MQKQIIPFYQHDRKTKPPKVWEKKTSSSEKCGLGLYARDQENLWHVDSACSRHMTSDRNKFVCFNEVQKGNVSFGNNSPAAIKGK